MAEWHLKELEDRLTDIGWKITSRIEGNSYEISASWILKRNTEIIVDFNGLDESETLPLNRAYACMLRGDGFNTSLYFYKKGEMWDENLDTFIQKINQLKKLPPLRED